MTPTPSTPVQPTAPLLHFSTDGQPVPATALRDLNRRQVVLPMTVLPGGLGRALIDVHGGADLRIMAAHLTGVEQRAPRERTVANPDDHLFLGVALTGTSIATMRGRTIAFGDGDAVLLARGEDGFRVCHPGPVRFLGLRMPRETLVPLVPRLDEVVSTRFARDVPAIRLLAAYTTSVLELGLLPSQPLVAQHIRDLVALASGADRDAAARAAGGLRGARLHTIQADIAAHLGHPELSVAWVAARHGITARYVHRLFERTDVTFSRFVLVGRLARAYRMLLDPRFNHRSIAQLAFDAGFADLSHFNRTFRRYYGATPREVRQRRPRAAS
jgi:AraC-like DNA-binding protein